MRRIATLACAGALFGLACGIALLPLWLRAAPAGQPPGLMSLIGLDARASFRFIAGIIILTIAGALLSRVALRRLALPDTRRWAFVTATIALLSSVWIAIAGRDLLWTIVPPSLVVLAADRLRHVRESFHRDDVALLPAFFCAFLAVGDLRPSLHLEQQVVLAALPLLAVRLAVRRNYAFALAPLALVLQSHYVGYRIRHAGWIPLLFVLASPLLVRRRLGRIKALVVYPMAILAFASATSVLAAEGKPRADLFEDAHNLTPAGELLRGERPYRDIIPSHGLLQDGLLDYLILRSGSVTAGRALRVHGTIGGWCSVAVYAVTAAATGSPELGLAAYFLGAALSWSGGSLRALPALVVLAIVVAAVRRRRPRLFAYAGVLLVLCALTSLDFAAYSAFAMLVALALVRPRRDALRAAALGFGAAALIALLGLAAAGILRDFATTTFIEIPRWTAAYALTPFAAPPAFGSSTNVPDVFVALLDRGALSYFFWPAVLIAFAVWLAIRRRSRRIDALAVIAAWIVISGVSYAERQHAYFQFLVAPLIVAVSALLLRVRRPALAAVLLVIAIVCARPAAWLQTIDVLRHTRGPLDPALTTIDELPRAGGAWYRAEEAARVRDAWAYVSTRLAPDETFVDFTNRGSLYFLFARDCPLREVEVAFYEPRAQQLEVIRRIDANRRVVAALVPREGDASVTVDGVPNELRAPLVWEYLRRNFRPDYAVRDVVFWRRVNAAP
jgi:hypothetical protein